MNSPRRERALLVQPAAPGQRDPAIAEEFADLARSAGAEVVAVVDARVERPSASHYLGSGKVEELKGFCEAADVDLVLVNATLSPVQERNLGDDLGRRVIDRVGLILDIFALRAASADGKLQVELAQLKHSATRLTGKGKGMDSQRGGSIGLRGPGETALETDRRLIRARIDALEKRLSRIDVQRTQMRRARMRNELPRVAIVGYTNAGKSTLFNALTGSGVYAADQLSRRWTRPCAASTAWPAARCCCPTPSVSSATCRTTWWRPSAPRWPKRARPTCCCTSSTPPIPSATRGLLR